MPFQVTKERKVIAYSVFWASSRFFLEQGIKETTGSYYQFLGSLVFSAFTYEAFLNHIGESLFSDWLENERSYSHSRKLKLICEKLNLNLNIDIEPWKTTKVLMDFRDQIAHGKNAPLFVPDIIVNDRQKYDDVMKEFLETDWQKFVCEKNAISARENLEALFKLLHEKTGIEDHILFGYGRQTSMGKYIPDEESE